MRKILSILLLFSCLVLSSQNIPIVQPIETDTLEMDTIENSVKKIKIKPLRIGIRVGVPHLITGNIEYVTPLFDNRLALTMDYITLSKRFTDGIFRFDNFEAGANIYFKNTGKGLYGSLTYFSFRSGVGFTDHNFGQGFRSDGRADFDFNSFNVKLGAKLGKTIYFRVELGYGIGKIPDSVEVISTTYNLSTLEEIPSVAGVSSSGVIVFNIGFGVGLF